MLATPLPERFTLKDRYVLSHVLGRGGFGISYLAHDQERGDACVIKELAPDGCTRLPEGRMGFDNLGPSQAHRLRHQFLREAEMLHGLRIPGVLPVRDAFELNNTAYFVSRHLEGSETLTRFVARHGRLRSEDVLIIVTQLLETLQSLHEHRILHRDIKPSNILIDAEGKPYLIDFGSARAWAADATVTHTVLYTPGFAPIEQLSEKARRGPATDIYGLCATAYWMLTGEIPPSATDRAAETDLVPIRSVRSDLDPIFADAIESGLAFRMHDRPQDCVELLDRLESVPIGDETLIERLDQKMIRLQTLRPGKRECPACGDSLEEPRPLGAGVCPVCRETKLEKRRIEPHLCPICRIGTMRGVKNVAPLAYCPTCRTGRLKAVGLPIGKRKFQCQGCEATYEQHGFEVVRLTDDHVSDWEGWRHHAGRTEQVEECDVCHAQFDLLEDDRRELIFSDRGPVTWKTLHADEWALVAAGLQPGSGNAECPSCDADFYLEGEQMTLLDAPTDPFRFAEEYLGKLLDRSAVQYLAVGKSSGSPGLVCGACRTEFDVDPDGYELAWTRSKLLRKAAKKVMSLLDWHRFANQLPLVGHENDLKSALEQAIRQAFHDGEIPFDPKHPEIHWRGGAVDVDSGSRTSATWSAETLELGSFLRKRRVNWLLAEEISSEGQDEITLSFAEAELSLALDPVDLQVRLESGVYEIELTASDLKARLMHQLRPIPGAERGRTVRVSR